MKRDKTNVVDQPCIQGEVADVLDAQACLQDLDILSLISSFSCLVFFTFFQGPFASSAGSASSSVTFNIFFTWKHKRIDHKIIFCCQTITIQNQELDLRRSTMHCSNLAFVAGGSSIHESDAPPPQIDCLLRQERCGAAPAHLLPFSF